MAITISILAAVISLASLSFAMWSWSQANRPVVVAYIESVASGNRGVALNLVVENVGNRPAAQIILTATPADIAGTLCAPATDPLSVAATKCLTRRGTITVLKPGQRLTNAFGCLNDGPDSTWIPEGRLAVKIQYEGYDRRRRYTNRCELLLSDDHGFAGSSWRASSA